MPRPTACRIVRTNTMLTFRMGRRWGLDCIHVFQNVSLRGFTARAVEILCRGLEVVAQVTQRYRHIRFA